jgi:hypothetical protein
MPLAIDDAALVERVAKAIYHRDAGLTDEDYYYAMGESRRAWSDDKPWDSDPENTLCEHERDEYRAMAKAAIEALLSV